MRAICYLCFYIETIIFFRKAATNANRIVFNAITYVGYSWSTITTQVTTNNAILLAGTDAEMNPDYPNHWIIVYGYKTVSGERFLLINDGWGDDEIYTTADSQYYPWGWGCTSMRSKFCP